MFDHIGATTSEEETTQYRGSGSACNNANGKRFPVADFASPSAIRVLAIGDPGFRVLPGLSVLVLLLVVLLAVGAFGTWSNEGSSSAFVGSGWGN